MKRGSIARERVDGAEESVAAAAALANARCPIFCLSDRRVVV